MTPISIGEAYREQDRMVGRELTTGRRIGGYKIGLTATSLQSAFGTDSPVRGVIFADQIHSDGSRIGLHELMSPRLEVELAFLLERPLVGLRVTKEQAGAAVGEIALAFEIVDSRSGIWSTTAIDLVADNSAAAAAVLGQPVGYTGQDLTDLSCTLRSGDGAELTGTSGAVLGDPLIALAWLAGHLSASGQELEPGQVVMSGTWLPPVTLTEPQSYRATADLLGEVSMEL